MLMVDHGFTRTFKGVTHEAARQRIEVALKAEGFGVLTEIDVKATFKAKLNVEYPNYLILGACNPTIAHQALSTDPGVGLLLPCNVVVTQDAAGDAVVSILDPAAMMKLMPGTTALAVPMNDARERLKRALDRA